MLQAQIDILDDAGQTEESVTILGSGQVSLGRRETGGYLHADEAAPDLAVITQDGARVLIEVKVPNVLQRDEVFVAKGSYDLTFARSAYLAFLEATRRRYLRVKQVAVSGQLLRGNAIIHMSSPSLIDRARAAAERGAARGRGAGDAGDLIFGSAPGRFW